MEKGDNEFSIDRSVKSGLYAQCKICNREYRQTHLESIREYQTNYYQTHCEQIKKSVREYNSLPDNKLKIRDRNRNKSHTNIQYRLAHNLRTRLGKLVYRNQKNGSAVQDLGCSVDELKTHLENQFTKGMSWENWGSGNGMWNVDHIVPAHMLDLTDRVHLLLFCNFRNLRPMWQIDNIQRDYLDIIDNKEVMKIIFNLC